MHRRGSSPTLVTKIGMNEQDASAHPLKYVVSCFFCISETCQVATLTKSRWLSIQLRYDRTKILESIQTDEEFRERVADICNITIRSHSTCTLKESFLTFLDKVKEVP